MSEFGCGKNNRIIKRDHKRSCTCSNEDGNQMPPEQLEPELTDLILNPKSKKIARPPNAFMLFARDHRKSLAMKYPTHNNKNISSLLGEWWRKVDQATKEEYYKKSRMLEELHKQKYPGYVYSPRIARMQKLARKKKTPVKCGDNNKPDNEVPIEPTGSSNTCIDGNEKIVEWIESSSEKKQPSPGYIPNNPQYFTDPDNGTQPEMPCTAQECAYPTCPPPPWNMPRETIAMPYVGRCSEESEAQSAMYDDIYYNRSEMCDYGPWNWYPDYPYESPMSSPWSSCASGCQGECCSVHLSDEHKSYSHLSSRQADLKNPYFRYNLSTPHRNYPNSCSYRPYRDSPFPYRTRHHVPYTIAPPKANPPYFPQTMDYYPHQYQQPTKDYYPKFSYPTQPIQETISSSVCPPEICTSRTCNIEEIIQPNNIAEGTNCLYQDVQRVKAESYGNEIFAVANEETVQNDVLTEEVVKSEDLEIEQVVLDVIGM